MCTASGDGAETKKTRQLLPEIVLPQVMNTLMVPQLKVPLNQNNLQTNKTQTNFLKSLAIGSIVEATDGTRWEAVVPTAGRSGRRAQHNVFKDEAGPSPHAKRYIVGGATASSWRLLIDNYILKHIRRCTETETRRILENNDWSLSLDELKAFLGILYVRGATESKGMEVDVMWSEKYEHPFFKNVMPRNRFREIMRFLRFDLKSTRAERLKDDKYGMLSEVFYRFISNAQSLYVPGPFISVDEQLFPSKERFRFTQFVASKPDKYGQKYWMAVDKESKYVTNAFPYLGRDDERPGGDRLGDYVVKRLVEP